MVLKFVVYDYDGPVVGDDFLGVAKLPLSKVSRSYVGYDMVVCLVL